MANYIGGLAPPWPLKSPWGHSGWLESPLGAPWPFRLYALSRAHTPFEDLQGLKGPMNPSMAYLLTCLRRDPRLDTISCETLHLAKLQLL